MSSKSHDDTESNTTEVPSAHNQKCDVCGYGDGHKSLRLLECKECHMAVHRDCYGMPTYTLREFVCWPCQAVGDTIRVKHEDKCVSLVVDKRPKHCDLCGHEDEDPGKMRALHPLYDNYGVKARQHYTLQDDKRIRLAWCHTVCGFLLSVRGLMYSATRSGMTHEGLWENEDDDRSINSYLDIDESDEEGDVVGDGMDPFQGFAPTHHFVWHTEPKYKKVIREHQLALKCEICRKDDYDTAKKIFRVPIQCSANDKMEYGPFRSTHTHSLADDQTCTLAYHVGCARYFKSSDDSKGPLLRRVYYFPGLPDDASMEPISCLYCPQHASEVDRKERKQIVQETELKEQQLRNKRKRAMEEKQRVLSLDQYNVHDDGCQAEESNDRSVAEPNVPAEDPDDILNRMKRFMTRKIKNGTVTPETAKSFIKESKKAWSEAARKQGFSDEEFSNLWKQVKAHANKVHSQLKEERQQKRKAIMD